MGFLGGLALCAIACGGGSASGTVSCTISENAGGALAVQLCEEGSAAVQQQLRQSCMGTGTQSLPDAGISISINVTFADGPCSHVNTLGGCQLVQNGATFLPP